MNTSNFSFPTPLSFPNNLSEVTVNGIDVVASVVWSELPFTQPQKTTSSDGVGALLASDNISALEKTAEPLPHTDKFALLNTPTVTVTVTVQVAPLASQELPAVTLRLGADNLFSAALVDTSRRSPLEPAAKLGARQQILVQWQPNLSGEHRDNMRSLLGGRLVEAIHTATMKRFNTGVLDVIEVPQGMEAEKLLQIYAQRSDVVFAELNYVVQTNAVSNDPNYTNGSLWGMYSNDLPSPVGPNGTTNIYGSQAEKAWERGLVGSNSVYVGIIDEGIQFDHPDLAANIWLNPFDPIDGIDNDGNGYVDDIRGWDFFNDDNSIYDGSVDNHGTHVAGTVGGVGGNGIGVAGVNWNVTMIATKFLGEEGGTIAGAIKAVDYLTDLKVRHGINIVASNNSWSGGGFSQGLLDAMVRGAQQDILFVASAGNATRNNDVRVSYPSGYDTTAGAGYDAVVAVASIDKLGNISSFSNYGANSVDLGAPGSSIYSTLPNGTYGSLSGTSMAAPHVTGAIALYAAANPNTSGAVIRDALLSSTAATASLADKTVTGGRLDVNSMLLFDPAPPTLAIAALASDQSEGNAGTKAFTFNVTRSGNSSGSNSVNWSLSGTGENPADAQDFGGTLPSGTLNFAAGETVREIVVNVSGDLATEADETFIVTLSDPTQGAVLSTATAEGVIRNDDIFVAPTLAIAALASDQSEGDAGTKAFTFTVTRSGNWWVSNSVNWSLSGTGENPADAQDFGGTLPSGTLNFAAGETVQEIVVNVSGDLATEADETFIVTLSDPTQGAILSTASAEGVIRNDDIFVAPTLAIAALASDQNEGDAGTKAFTFTVTRSGNSSGSNSVNWSLSGTGENPADAQDFGGTLPSGTLNFAAGETVQEIVVNVSGDLATEADETFIVTLSGPTQGAILSTASAEGIIRNDDQNTSMVIFSHGFEKNQDSNLWTQDKQKDWFTSSQRAKSGSYSAEIDGKATNATLGLTSPLNLSAYEDLSLSFSWFIESNWDNGEYVALDFFNNGVWSEVQRLSGNQSPEGVWNDVTIALPNSANFNFRFRSSVSASDEDGNVDDIVIMGTTTNANSSALLGELGTTSIFASTEAYGLTNPY